MAVDRDTEWRQEIRTIRRRLGLSQQVLAHRAGISAESLRKYEAGKRHPSREHLTAILDALRIERTARNQILDWAGYASDWTALAPTIASIGFSLETAAEEVERVAWPCFVLNEMSEVVVANTKVQALWGVDLRREFVDIADRNMLSVASNPRFADRCANWDEAVGTLISVFKGHHRGHEDIDEPSPYFQSVLNKFLAGDPRYIKRFLDLWQTVEPATMRLRWHYPVVWRDPDAGLMRFDCVVSTANERDGWSFNDWIPVDDESWRVLAEITRRRG